MAELVPGVLRVMAEMEPPYMPPTYTASSRMMAEAGSLKV